MLLQVLFWDAVWGVVGGAGDGAGARLTAGCCLGRSSGGAVGGAGVQSLLFGVYAGVFFFVDVLVYARHDCFNKLEAESLEVESKILFWVYHGVGLNMDQQ